MVSNPNSFDEKRRKRNQDLKRKYRRRLILCNQQAMEDFIPIILKIRDDKGRFVSGGIKPMLGRKHKQSTIKLLSFTKIGSKNPMFAKHLSDNQKNNLGVLSKKRWQDPKYREMMILKNRSPNFVNSGRFQKGRICSEKERRNNSERMKNTPRYWKAVYKDTKPERMMQIALSLNGVKFEKQKMFKIGRSWHKVDIFIEPNICVEVDGVYWHLPPEKIRRDLSQTQILTILGYHIIRIRDKDIIKNANDAANNVVNLIKQIREIPDLRKEI